MSKITLDEDAVERTLRFWVGKGWRQFTASRIRRTLKTYLEAARTPATPVQPDEYPWCFRNEDEIIAHFRMLWRQYGLANDDALTTDAINLKGKMLAAIESLGVPVRELGKEAERAELQGFINGIVTILNCRTPSSTTPDGANTLNELRAIGDVKIGMANDELAEIRRNEIEDGEPKPIADKSPEAASSAGVGDERTEMLVYNEITNLCARSEGSLFKLLPSERMALTEIAIAALSGDQGRGDVLDASKPQNQWNAATVRHEAARQEADRRGGKTSWTCPDCCVNPCKCGIYPMGGAGQTLLTNSLSKENGETFTKAQTDGTASREYDYQPYAWLPHNGGGCPVHEDTVVDVRYMFSELKNCSAGHMDWSRIIAYRIVKWRGGA